MAKASSFPTWPLVSCPQEHCQLAPSYPFSRQFPVNSAGSMWTRHSFRLLRKVPPATAFTPLWEAACISVTDILPSVGCGVLTLHPGHLLGTTGYDETIPLAPGGCLVGLMSFWRLHIAALKSGWGLLPSWHGAGVREPPSPTFPGARCLSGL